MDSETKQMLEMIMKKLDRIDEKQTNMETDINNIKARQDEIFFVVKAIEHSNTIGKAEIDNLTFKVAHNEGIISRELTSSYLLAPRGKDHIFGKYLSVMQILQLPKKEKLQRCEFKIVTGEIDNIGITREKLLKNNTIKFKAVFYRNM